MIIVKANHRKKTPVRSSAFSLIEVMVAMGVIGIVVTTLYAAFASGFSIIQLARENLRATQIMLEKTETIRLYSWDQVNSNGFIPANFTAAYDPLNSNYSPGLTYYGTVIISNAPMQTTYSPEMRQIVILLDWQTGNLQRHREFTTFIAKDGLQNYVY